MFVHQLAMKFAHWKCENGESWPETNFDFWGLISMHQILPLTILNYFLSWMSIFCKFIAFHCKIYSATHPIKVIARICVICRGKQIRKDRKAEIFDLQDSIPSYWTIKKIDKEACPWKISLNLYFISQHEYSKLQIQILLHYKSIQSELYIEISSYFNKSI